MLCNKDPLTLKSGKYMADIFPNSKWGKWIPIQSLGQLLSRGCNTLLWYLPQVVVYGQGREGGDTQCYFEKGVLSSIQHILILLSSSTYWWLRTWKIQDKQYITNPSKVTISGYKLDDPRQCLSRWNTVVRREDFQNTYFLNTTTLVAFSPPIEQMMIVA